MPKHRRPKYLKNNELCLDKEMCPNSPDLLLLRDAAADERNAILEYLQAASDNCLAELFLDIAEDEMHHYMEIMREIVRLDPVQAEMFQEVNLDMMAMGRPVKMPGKKWHYMHNPAIAADEEELDDLMIALPSERNMAILCRLTKALAGEFEATNKYQRYMNEACDPQVKRLFCHLMNEEKEHIAELTAAIFDITGEPLPYEHRD